MGNSWTGMLLREQGVREESRFSGSGPTPCSAIPSLARCHSRRRVRTRSESQEALASSPSAGSWSFGGEQPLCSVSSSSFCFIASLRVFSNGVSVELPFIRLDFPSERVSMQGKLAQ